MTTLEALEKICFLLKHDWYAPEIKAILEELEKSAYNEGYAVGEKLYDQGYQLGQEHGGRRSADR